MIDSFRTTALQLNSYRILDKPLLNDIASNYQRVSPALSNWLPPAASSTTTSPLSILHSTAGANKIILLTCSINCSLDLPKSHVSQRCSISLNFLKQKSLSSKKAHSPIFCFQGESFLAFASRELGGLTIQTYLLSPLSSVRSLARKDSPVAALSLISRWVLLLLRPSFDTPQPANLFFLPSSSFLPPLLSNSFLNHCRNSRLSWYLHFTSFSTSMFFIIPNLVKLCWRILKFATNSQSNFAFTLTFPRGTRPGQSTSVNWQQIAPVPSCSIFDRDEPSSSLTQLSNSPRDSSIALLELTVTSFSILTVTVITQPPTQSRPFTPSPVTCKPNLLPNPTLIQSTC